jgi:hypothetical protein
MSRNSAALNPGWTAMTAAPIRTLREDSGAGGVIDKDTHCGGEAAAASAANLRFQ